MTTDASAAMSAAIRISMAGHADDAGELVATMSALAAERDALSQQLAEARNELEAARNDIG